ncbi:gliding motility lipoprotein GldH [Flavisolibacter ginsenosidimutans]|uniref:Gliding motility lipoprotein GldH n=1 Tax=Flavisolibacter ginsenosidimutans TaxID=661481 RepID=A0A5B8UL59_9BACT|nr:gliding motility lipoprotein GldH [Flavisolibacter ginsenosidimutans]QEC57441.1 gliding motility lipoprotein GldH [Flavisolibacter ginsenosidimutans]
MIVFKKLRGFVYCLLLIALCAFLFSCDRINLYEKVVPVPKHQWQSNFKPEFTFTIKDTAVPYQLYFIVRHNNQYKYNNVWVNLYAKGPADTVHKFVLELPLANKEGWLGSGMDDVFEHRVGFVLDPQKFSFDRAGEYSFTLEQIMRDDPLPNIMDVGLRLEKKTP